MYDPHQMHSLIAEAISQCRKDHPQGEILAEEAKVMAKCIVQQLADAGYHISVKADTDDSPGRGEVKPAPESPVHG